MTDNEQAEKAMIEVLDGIIVHCRCLKHLMRNDIPAKKALELVGLEMLQHQTRNEPKELDEVYEENVKSDLQELIDDDNRERARDMNLAMQGR